MTEELKALILAYEEAEGDYSAAGTEILKGLLNEGKDREAIEFLAVLRLDQIGWHLLEIKDGMRMAKYAAKN